MITLDKALLDSRGLPDGKTLLHLLQAQQETLTRREALRQVYDRRHPILNRTRLRGLPNHRLVHDFPGYIVAITAGYLLGNPVEYVARGQEAALAPLTAAYQAAATPTVDAELAVDAAVYGLAMEILYADGQAQPRTAQVDPRTAFVVYDDTVEHRPLLGIVTHALTGEDWQPSGRRITVYTEAASQAYRQKAQEAPVAQGQPTPHFFGGVPLIEYWNNAREQGDFEPVLSLLDAYDALQSDRVNDKQQFTDSILALYGVSGLGPSEQETPLEDLGEGEGLAGGSLASGQGGGLTPAQRLRQTKTLFMPADGAKAEYLVKPATEGDTEVLRGSLREDIHKFSLTPDLSDEQFAGNSSGVAMRYKLFGLEQLTKTKERWFAEGLRWRLRLFAHFLGQKGAAELDAEKVRIVFQRSLPVNELEVAQMVNSLRGLVPEEVLLAQLPFGGEVAEAAEEAATPAALGAK